MTVMQPMPRVNLLPHDLQPKPLFRWKVVLSIIVIILLISSISLYLFLLMIDLHNMRQEETVLQHEIAGLQHLPAKEARLRQLEAQLRETITEYTKGRLHETAVVALVHERLPVSSTLLNLSIQANGAVSFRGYVDSYDTAAHLTMNFMSHPLITDVNLQSLSKIEDGQYAFHLNCIILWGEGGEGQ